MDEGVGQSQAYKAAAVQCIRHLMQSLLAGFEKAAAKAEEMVIEQRGKRKERYALELSSLLDRL